MSRIIDALAADAPRALAAIDAARARVRAAVWALAGEDASGAAADADGAVREGAWVAELTGLLDLGRWPPEMRVMARKETPAPGAQLRITDADGHRVTAFATNTTKGQLADLELRHRRRAPTEDRIRTAKGHRADQPAACHNHVTTGATAPEP